MKKRGMKIPTDYQTWITEIAKAYQEAKETIPYGASIGEKNNKKRIVSDAQQILRLSYNFVNSLIITLVR